MSSAPLRWPLDPVPGMAKLTIWAEKTNAAITPATGVRDESFTCFKAFATRPRAIAEIVQKAIPTGAERYGSDRCKLDGFHGAGLVREGSIQLSRHQAFEIDFDIGETESSQLLANPVQYDGGRQQLDLVRGDFDPGC
jgi:hypothetical protein